MDHDELALQIWEDEGGALAEFGGLAMKPNIDSYWTNTDLNHCPLVPIQKNTKTASGI